MQFGGVGHVDRWCVGVRCRIVRFILRFRVCCCGSGRVAGLGGCRFRKGRQSRTAGRGLSGAGAQEGCPRRFRGRGVPLDLAAEMLQVRQFPGGLLPGPVQVCFETAECGSGAVPFGEIAAAHESGERIVVELGVAGSAIRRAVAGVEVVSGVPGHAVHAPLETGQLGDELVFLQVEGAEAAHGGVVECVPVLGRLVGEDVAIRGADTVFDGVAAGDGLARVRGRPLRAAAVARDISLPPSWSATVSRARAGPAVQRL